ncbi:MAG: sigma 54-interacting transcriptional regulator, partial [Thermoanaerobaculia bacterium]
DPSGIISVEGLDLTESFSPLDSFALDHLPKLLEKLANGSDRQQMAHLLGSVLFEAMPVTGVEILQTGDGEEGVLYSAERPDDETLDLDWVEEAAGNCQVRVQFFRKAAGDYYRPVVQSVLWMLNLTDRDRDLPRPSLPSSPLSRPQPLTVDTEIQRIYNDAERVARGDVGVLIYGESGTGKEVLARFIHAASPRADQQLVTINCASLPRDLLESELFGVERGVATGVEARPGKFETADQGTLFLDEIGDMAIEAQAKILRVLQEQEVFRIGGRTPRPARARVVAATNRPIHKMLAEGSFRSDLYHRIATWEVELPPLRRRRRDIANLATHFLARSAQRLGIRVRGISRAALQALRRYRWPGNIRQLRNEIARAVLFLENRELLDTTRLGPEITGKSATNPGASLSEILDSVEREEILDTLERCGGDTTAAAEQLKISRPTLYRRIKSLKIAPQNLPKLGE